MRSWNTSNHTYANAMQHIKKHRDTQLEIKIANNTTLVRGPDDEYVGLRLHSTYVAMYYPNNTTKLYTNGWTTTITRNRMQRYTPISFGPAKKGRWQVYTKSGIVSPGKIWKCKSCLGRHEFDSSDKELAALWALRGYMNYKDCYAGARWVCNHEHMYRCYRCQNTGLVDYGSLPETVEFYDGITIDSKEGTVFS